jgi:hypothetical protein
MSDWVSDDSDNDTPLPPHLAEFERAVSEDLMETAADFAIEQSIFGKRSGSKATKGKGNMARASWAPATPTPSTMSRGTTPLSHASASTPSVASQGSLTPRSSPTPVVRSLPQKALLECIHSSVGIFKLNSKDFQTMQFFGQFADEILQFILQVLSTPSLKDHPFQSIGGILSFEVQLAQIIATTGPPPPHQQLPLPLSRLPRVLVLLTLRPR